MIGINKNCNRSLKNFDCGKKKLDQHKHKLYGTNKKILRIGGTYMVGTPSSIKHRNNGKKTPKLKLRCCTLQNPKKQTKGNKKSDEKKKGKIIL